MQEDRLQRAALWLLVLGLLAHFGFVGAALIVAFVMVVLWVYSTVEVG